MLKCEICETEPQTQLLTRCCKLFICDMCRDKYQKTGTCACGKSIIKKLCTANPELFETIDAYYRSQPEECDRCEKLIEVWCAKCNMSFCQTCDREVHDAKGFAKHNREAIEKNGQLQKAVQKFNRRQQYCQEHKAIIESVCECSQFLCAYCLKAHKDSCTRFGRPKPLKEYKEQYFCQIASKIKKISQYKQRLIADRKTYVQHFHKQRDTYETYSRTIEEQLEGIRNILDTRLKEIKQKLTSYWNQCMEAHSRNCLNIDYQIQKFDDLSRLSEKLVEKTIGYEYLEKRVKRFYISQDYFNFKLQGLEDLQLAALNLGSTAKAWDLNQPEALARNFDQIDDKQKGLKEKKGEQSIQQASITSELFLECVQNPLKSRPLSLKSSHNQILFEFLHLPHKNDQYEIEYGVGLKMKGQEIFKKIENRSGIGIISNLNPSTKYRVRMRVCGGQWGSIFEIKTQETPKFLTEICSNSKHTQQITLQVLKAGVIYGSNQILFGVQNWEIKIFPPKNTDEETACISIGVSNKEQKKPVFVGITLNYGYQKAILIVRVSLNCDENKMSISSSTSNQDEVYSNLPNLPIYPTIQNKGSHPVQIQCSFT